MTREQFSSEPKRKHAETEPAATATPATAVCEPAPRAPATETVRIGGQRKPEGRSAGAVVGLSGSMRARDVSRPSVTPRHES